MEYLEAHHLGGLVIGVAAFLVIGIFHPITIKAEYYWGTRSWWVFLSLGIAGAAVSVITANIIVSAICGVFAFSSFWTIKELFEQKKRVERGWFPKNPDRRER